MRRFAYPAALLAGVLALVHPRMAEAQGALVYATGGPAAAWNIGDRDVAWLIGGGVEMLNGPLGLGGEVGYVYFPEVNKTFDGGRGALSSPAVGASTFSGIATFHFGSTYVDHRVRPFVSTGLTVLFAEEVMPVLFQLSGGVDWRVGRRTSLRFEARQQFGSILGVRVGVVFR